MGRVPSTDFALRIFCDDIFDRGSRLGGCYALENRTMAVPKNMDLGQKLMRIASGGGEIVGVHGELTAKLADAARGGEAVFHPRGPGVSMGRGAPGRKGQLGHYHGSRSPLPKPPVDGFHHLPDPVLDPAFPSLG